MAGMPQAQESDFVPLVYAANCFQREIRERGDSCIVKVVLPL